MPSESSAPIAHPAQAATDSPLPPPHDVRSRSAAKGVATVRRHKEERRAASLLQIRAQIADGTLVVRQMTPAQLTASVAQRQAPSKTRPS